MSSRHRIWNSSPGGLSPSTLPLGHRGSPQYWLYTWMGKKYFQTAETGNRTPNSRVKGSGANHYPRAPFHTLMKAPQQTQDDESMLVKRWSTVIFCQVIFPLVSVYRLAWIPQVAVFRDVTDWLERHLIIWHSAVCNLQFELLSATTYC